MFIDVLLADSGLLGVAPLYEELGITCSFVGRVRLCLLYDSCKISLDLHVSCLRRASHQHLEEKQKNLLPQIACMLAYRSNEDSRHKEPQNGMSTNKQLV
jgi:hypothetical protein